MSLGSFLMCIMKSFGVFRSRVSVYSLPSRGKGLWFDIIDNRYISMNEGTFRRLYLPKLVEEKRGE